MAAAIIPIIAELAPVVIPAIVKLVEGFFGPKSGEAKMDTSLDWLKTLLVKTGAVGPDKPMPDDASLRTMVETVLQSLKAKGELSPGAATQPADRDIALAKLLIQAAGAALER